ncbi:MAG TPA: CdaR family protein [Patescibacteria group bacterium]|nr:CdaR family protein [Patescibacteria group bacterium]
MNFNQFIRGIGSNIGAKVIAILFAVFFWLHVTAQQEEKQSFRVPLTLAAMPDSLTIIHTVPGFVEVTVQGARSNLLRLRFLGRLKATVDLSAATGGRIDIPLSAAILNLPKEVDPRNVTVDNPKTLSLNFERVISKSVPVKIAYRGEIPQDIIITGHPVFIPDKVQVRGAASVVGGVSLLTTEEVDIRGKSGRITLEVGVQTGGANVTVSPEKVLLEMEVKKRAVRTLANIPPTLLRDDERLIVSYTPRVVSLTVEGPEDVVKTIVSDEISVILNITTKTPGTYRLQPEVIVPPGIEKYWLDIDAFEIEIHAPMPDEFDKNEKE